MNVTFISINGVLRDWWNKLIYEYKNFYFDMEPTEEETFEYKVYDIVTHEISEKLAFQSEDEMKYFLYVDSPMEIYGHAAPSYKNVMLDLYKYYKEQGYPKLSLVSKEAIKSIPATLFFLSKTSCTINNIQFYQNDEEVSKLWEQCDVWITDDPVIINHKPENKKVIKLLQDFNKDLPCDQEITALYELLQNEEEQQQRLHDSAR